MPAGTIALTNNSTAVAGSGTNFTTELKVGDFVYTNVGGAPFTLVVASISSDTQLSVAIAFDGPTTSGLSWNAVPTSIQVAITQKILNDFASVARGRILDFQNWQKIYSDAQSVTVTRPDRTQFTGPSWGYMATQYSGKLDKSQNLLDLKDIAEARKNLKLGTAATASVGTGVNQIPDMNSFALAPGGGGASFRRLPGGDILQIGRLQTSANGTLTGTLNVAFPNANYSIVAVAQDQQASITCAPLTGSTFAISAWGIGNTGALGSRVTTLVSWFAWGN